MPSQDQQNIHTKRHGALVLYPVRVPARGKKRGGPGPSLRTCRPACMNPPKVTPALSVTFGRNVAEAHKSEHGKDLPEQFALTIDLRSQPKRAAPSVQRRHHAALFRWQHKTLMGMNKSLHSSYTAGLRLKINYNRCPEWLL